MHRNFKLLPWQMMGCAALLLSDGATAQAQTLPLETILLRQSTFKSGDELYAEGDEFYFLGTGEGYEQAIELYKQALDAYEQEGDLSGQAITNNDIGISYDRLDYKQEALTYFEEALPLYQAVGDRSGEAATLNNIGAVYSDLGEKEKALTYYKEVLPLYRAVGDRSGEAATLNNIGLVYSDLGEKEKALAYYEEALPLRRAVGDRSGEATTLHNIGAVYDSLGEKEKALAYYEQTLAIDRAIGAAEGTQSAHSSEATTLNNIGLVYSDLGEKKKALTYYKEALPLYRAVGDRSGEATSLLNIGAVYSDLGNKKKALTYYKEALPLYRAVGNRSGEATNLSNIGAVYSDLGEKQVAFDYYQKTLPLFRAVGDRNGEAVTLDNLGFALQDDQPELAIIFYKQSVNLYETLRKDIEQLDPNIQKTYLSTVEGTYRRLADLLLQQNRVFEAQRVLDLLKVQELDDLFGNIQVRSGGENFGIFPLSPEAEFLERYNAKLREEITLSEERQILINKELSLGLTEQQKQRRRELDRLSNSQSASLQTFLNQPKIKELLNILKENFAIAGQDPTIDLKQRENIRRILEDVEQQGQKAAFLYPFILEDRLQLILITSHSAISRSVDISSTELNRRILAANTTLKDRTNLSSDYSTLEDLHTVLIAPIKAALEEAEITTLIYAPDKALRYIPLAALRDKTDQSWLIEKYRVNNITAQELTTLGRQIPKPIKVLAGAFTSGKYNLNVEVSDGRTQNIKKEEFRGLTYAGEEVEAIAAVANATILIDKDFGRNAILDFNGNTVIHFATHAKFLPDTPLDSFLVFGNGEYLTLRQMEAQHLVYGDPSLDIGEKWKLDQDQLVVLSACETALGSDFNPEKLKKANSGIEILGLSYQWQRQGARATIASLWQVQDESTQLLMQEFYRQLSTEKVSNVEALRQAQETLSQSAEYSHPHHWASFVLIGNGL